MRRGLRPGVASLCVALLAACASGSVAAPAVRVPARCRPAAARPSDLPSLDARSLTAHQMELAKPVHQMPITSASVRRRLDVQLDAARRFATAVRTVRDAKARGYVLTLAPESGSGAHWTNWSLVNCRFAAGRPSQVISAGMGDRSPIVALSYLVVHRGSPPRGFVGPNAQWHQHFALCVVDGALRARNACGPTRRLLDGRDLWMLHAWVVPEWRNPWGVFVPLNPRRLPPAERAAAESAPMVHGSEPVAP